MQVRAVSFVSLVVQFVEYAFQHCFDVTDVAVVVILADVFVRHLLYVVIQLVQRLHNPVQHPTAEKS